MNAVIPLFQQLMKASDKASRFTAASLLVSGLVLLSGCGPRSDRLEVTGRVMLDGIPVDTGSVRFTSIGAEKLVASGAMIENGDFRIPQEKGLPPGTYRVEISSPDTKAPLVVYPTPPGEPRLPPTAPERIPAQYNSNSKQTIEVTLDGENHFEFPINTRQSS